MELLKDVVARWARDEECDECGSTHDVNSDCEHGDFCECNDCTYCNCCSHSLNNCYCDHESGGWCED